ncbi:MAG: bifunctional DNA-formamidopyrimidine glycosylase/DNA-(apurinic or apyrimidinic site) lyase [Chloroflexi bacterium]|nr:bifunctional DNA-formamidopyrimidine glycosylase/DNA-(apurinic or apyrimidinic site) lyase [Chloroflexota bacterium]
MPELPEVETTARGLRERVVGARIRRVWGLDWPRMAPNADGALLSLALEGRSIEAVERRGKILLVRVEDGATLGLHRKMSGNVLVRASSAEMDPHTHLVLALEDGRDIRFVDARKFGRIWLFPTPAKAEQFLAERLGPEPLGEMTADRLWTMLHGRRGRIKALLLDQAFLAGVGNLYADEALWEAGIHPFTPAHRLTRADVGRLASALRDVLEAGIARRGTSFSTYLDADGLAGENQDYLRAYGRGASRGRPARPCDRCGTAFTTVLLGQRTSHYCPTCQRPPEAGRKGRAAAQPTAPTT